MFHELAGHMRRISYSQNLPETAQCKEMNYTFASAPVDEGVTINIERKGSMRYIKEHPDQLFVFSRNGQLLGRERLSAEQLERAELFIALESEEFNFHKFFTLVNLRIEDGQGYDPKQDLLPFTSMPLSKEMQAELYFHPQNYVHDIKGFRDSALADQYIYPENWRELPILVSYKKGQFVLERMKRQVKKRHGLEFYRQNKDFIHDISMTGNWSWRVFNDFVNYSIENKEEFYDMLKSK
jgi:hypothetical protein